MCGCEGCRAQSEGSGAVTRPRATAAMRSGQGEQKPDSQADAHESPEKKWFRLAMKSGFGEAALEGRGCLCGTRARGSYN